MPDWRSRLAVSVGGEVLTPVESFNSSLTLNTEVLHSIEETHIGYVANPAAFTFTISVRAIGPATALLTRLALEGREFEIVLQEAPDAGGDWSFRKTVFKRCLITSVNPSNAAINGAPAATVSGVCLEFTATDTAGDLTVP